MVAIISFVIPRFRKTVICDIWHIKNNGCRKRKRTFGNHEVSNFKVYCAKSLHIFHQTQSEADIPLITSNRSYLEFHLDVIYMVKRSLRLAVSFLPQICIYCRISIHLIKIQMK